MRRVVVTGLGMVTPLGSGVQENWKRLIKGESGISNIRGFEYTDLPSKVAGQIPQEGEGAFNPNDWMTPKEQKRVDRFIILGIAAATQALKDARWEPKTEEEKEYTGVLIGSGIGGLPEIARTAVILHEKGARRVSPFFIPASLINLTAGYISIYFGFTGPNHAVATACSSGSHAIGDAVRLIQCQDANVVVAGGAEAAVCPIGVAGFSAMRALSTHFNDDPTRASRPWDKLRDGFVISEGAGILVLEELEHAKNREAHIYGEIMGYGLSGDAHHVTSPTEDGDGAYRCMKMALRKAGLSPKDIDYINAHGTSTIVGDMAELHAVERLFPEGVTMSSTKSSTGHLLGAAGSVEAIFTLLSINKEIVPPTLNLENCLKETVIDLVPKKAKSCKINYALSNSFGFGGTNATLVFKKWEE